MKINETRRRVVQGLVQAGAALALPGAASSAADTREARALVAGGDGVVRAAVPAHFLGFNLEVLPFEPRYWSASLAQPLPGVVEAVRAFEGGCLRYPGGLVGNSFCSDWAVGPVKERRPQRLADWTGAAPVGFGPAEFFRFAASVGMKTIYTLNLVGWDEERFGVELPSEQVAAASGRLAALRVQMDAGDAQGVRLYHLGNELDRSGYDWPLRKYVQRCRDTIAAVRAADPKARFIGFLRDFDYPLPSGTLSKGPEFSASVLEAMPEVADGSLQVYYDRPANEGKRFDLPWRWKLIDGLFKSLDVKGHGDARFWVTEHAQYRDIRTRTLSTRERLATTSGIAGALASADFAMDALLRPRIEATMWHSLGGGIWWDVLENIDGKVSRTPAYHVFKLMREHLAGELLHCAVSSSNVGAYSGGYDVNAIVLRQGGAHVVHVVNRADAEAEVTVALAAWAHARLRVGSRVVAAARPPGGWLDELECTTLESPPAPQRADARGRLTVRLPARAFGVVRVTAA